MDTPASKAGKRLSGGEKQQIAIARMMLKNAPIVILDDMRISYLIQSAKKYKERLIKQEKFVDILIKVPLKNNEYFYNWRLRTTEQKRRLET